MSSLQLLIIFLCLSQAAAAPVVITGATGRTGAPLYNLLKKRGVEVRGFVRNSTKAKDLLECDKCNEAEGIFVGDIKDKSSMTKVMKGTGALVILTSSVPTCHRINSSFHCTFPKGAYPIDIDWVGAKNTLEAFAETAGVKPAVLVSTMGTTKPIEWGEGHVSFYKLNF